MPTKHNYIDVRDLFVTISPSGLDKKELERDGASFVEPHTINDYHLFRAGYQAALEAQQGQGEPIRLTAVATLEEDGDGGLEPNWLLEGGTAELLAGMTLLVADNAPHLCDDDGSAQVYTHADPTEALNDLEDAKEACAEIERTGTPGEVIRGMNDELVDARAQLDGLRESMEFRTSLIGQREAQLAEAHALLRLIAEQPMLNGVHRARIKTLLSASAEPSAPLPPVDGDLLPPINSKVLIHLGREEKWVEHTVVGYYAWGNHGLDQNVHRVFVRVRDAEGYLNARLLSDVRPVDAAPSQL